MQILLLLNDERVIENKIFVSLVQQVALTHQAVVQVDGEALGRSPDGLLVIADHFPKRRNDFDGSVDTVIHKGKIPLVSERLDASQEPGRRAYRSDGHQLSEQGSVAERRHIIQEQSGSANPDMKRTVLCQGLGWSSLQEKGETFALRSGQVMSQFVDDRVKSRLSLDRFFSTRYFSCQ